MVKKLPLLVGGAGFGVLVLLMIAFSSQLSNFFSPAEEIILYSDAENVGAGITTDSRDDGLPRPNNEAVENTEEGTTNRDDGLSRPNDEAIENAEEGTDSRNGTCTHPNGESVENTDDDVTHPNDEGIDNDTTEGTAEGIDNEHTDEDLARPNTEGVNDETDTIDAAIPSTDEEMMIALEEIPITPQLVTTSGNITIDIPDYDPSIGRGPGSEAAKDATIKVKFGTTTGTDKKIRIQVAEGFRFITYPVLSVQYSDREVLVDNEFKIVLENVTSKPQRQTHYPTYNSGYLEYKIRSDTIQIEISRLSFTVDEIVYYGSTGVLENAITVSSIVNGVIENQVSFDVQQAVHPSMYFHLGSEDWVIPQRLNGDTTPFKTPELNVGRQRLGSAYWKNVTAYYYYPIGLEYISCTPTTHTCTDFQNSGYVTISRDNTYYNYRGYPSLNLSAGNLPVGTYTAPEGIKIVYTAYDGTIIESKSNYKLIVKVIDPTTLTNKVSLGSVSRIYSPLASNYFTQGPSFHLYNEDPNIKTNQVMEYIIGTGYEVVQVSFPTTNGSAPTQVIWETRSGFTGTASSGQIFKTNFQDGKQGYGISTTSLGLGEEEYLSYAQAHIGDIKGNIPNRAGYNMDNYDLSTMHIIGRLSGTTGTIVKVNTRSDVGDGSKEVGSEVTLSQNIIYKEKARNQMLASVANGNFNVFAGEKKSISVHITQNNEVYLYTETLAYVNPTFYMIKPERMTIYTDSLRVTQEGNNIPFSISEYTTTQGKEVLAIHISAQVGSYFDMVRKRRILLTFDIKPDIDNVEVLNWKDYLFLTSENASSLSNLVRDMYDINNNGDITETIVSSSSSTMNILPSAVLLMDTYLIPDGGTRQPSYNPAQPTTAVAFTPGTVGKYEVVFDNQRSNTVGSLVYLPIPKVGNNFGINFQSTGFSRNMKLGGQPSITVYDQHGNNVTAARAENYVIHYSNDATNATNYETATYTTNYNGATMIRMKNDLQMLPGEKVVLSFDYIVDEANSSEKVGLVNDFMPYYYFEAGNIGWTNGSRVGAMLQVGAIGGMLFLDENADGVFNTGETKLANKTVNLYKGNTLQATVQTDINGHYLFSGLSNGIYRADFNDALGTYAHFTLKGTGDSSLTSQVEYVGANAGYSLNIDPVQSRAATINAGILNYIPSTDLTPTLYITGAILTLTTTGVTPTTGLQSTIAPSFFPHIQATSNAITRSSSDPTVASVSTTGRVEGKQAGTTTLTLTIKDLWGTTQTATTILTVENKIPLRCTIDYNPNSNTNGNVVATLTNCNKVITVTNNAGSINYVFTGNGNFDLHYQDSYGNTGTTTATVSRIDASEIQATITYVPDTPTSGNVQSIISFNKTGVTITSTAGTTTTTLAHDTYLFTDNGTFTYTYGDNFGNTGSSVAVVNWIDKTAPSCDITYTPHNKTNQNVVANLTNCSEAITGTSTSYTFTGNGNYTFHYTDLVGNPGSTTAAVDRIDKTTIIPTITYTITGATNQPVTASISFNKSGITLTSEGGISHLFTASGSFTFHFHDEYGNTGSAIATVDWIDTTGPKPMLSYNPATATYQPVLVTLTTDEPISQPTGWSGAATGTLFTKTYTGNTSAPITVYDLVGNQGQTWLTIDWIDTSPVVGDINYSTTSLTNGDVIATISFNKSGVVVTNNGGSTGYTFTENGDFTFTFSDRHGNTGSEKAEVYWISDLSDEHLICASITDIPEVECTALVDFYYATNGDGWTKGFSGDTVENKPRLRGNQACSWFGIVCEASTPKHIIEITLNSNTLSGKLPVTLAQLTKIKTLALIDNKITGTLPEALATRTDMQSFRMEKNQLQGVLPKEWSTWTNLKRFYVSQNEIIGTLPKEWSSWENIQYFSVRDNHIGGVLPPEWATWKNIIYFYVYKNEITGTLPVSYASWTGIVDFYTHTNRMSGTLPKEYQSWEKIEDVRIQNNAYEGLFPSERGTWNTLRKLYIENNKLTGLLPEHWTVLLSVVTGEVSIDNNCLDIHLKYPLSSWMDEKSSNGAGWRTTQTNCPLLPLTPSPEHGGGGGGYLQKDHCPNGDFSSSYYDGACGTSTHATDSLTSSSDPQTDNNAHGLPEDNASIVPTKMLAVYEWAKEYGITTADTYEALKISDAIIRQEMAKMISVFATKLLHKSPNNEKAECTQFSDLSSANDNLQPYIVESCQLGLMGMQGDGVGVQESFFPHGTITRAEVGTILSRLLRGTTYASQQGDAAYYARHLQALKDAGIMRIIAQPERVELRGNILLMLWNSAGK